MKKRKHNIKYNRVLLKLSGEVLGNRATGDCLDPANLTYMAECVKAVYKRGVQIGIVLGGGNIFRGSAGMGKGVDRVTGDAMGMLATVINALALANALEAVGVSTTVMSTLEMPKIAEPFVQRKALKLLKDGNVVIFAGGTGNPYFSTDSAAALKACEIGADVLLKATKVDGVYSSDPVKNPKAKKYQKLNYETAIENRLKVMDASAFALCMDNELPIIVFNFFESEAFLRVVAGETIGTIISDCNSI